MSPPRTPLLRPNSYFSERTATLGHAIVVAIVLVLGFVGIVYALGGVFVLNIDGTVETSNPAYPGDAFCDGDTPGDTPSGCSEPATIERNVDGIIWDAIGSLAGQVVAGLGITWLLVAGLLHGGSALANGDGAAERSLAVAAWGLLPTLLGAVVAILALALTFDPVSVSPGTSQDVIRERVLAQFDVLRLVGGAASVVTVVWGAVVWRFGIQHQRDVPEKWATAIAATVALLLLLLGAA